MEPEEKGDVNEEASASPFPAVAIPKETRTEQSELEPSAYLDTALSFPGVAAHKVHDITSKAFHKGKDMLPPTRSECTESHCSPSSILTGDVEIHPALTYEYLKTDPAFNPAEVSDSRPPPAIGSVKGPKIFHGGVKGATKEIVGSVFHPRRAVIQHYQSKTAKSLSKATRPYISPQSDRDFLAAHDALFEAETDQQDINNKRRKRTASLLSRSQETPNDMGSGQGNREQGAEIRMTKTQLSSPTDFQKSKVERLESHRQSLAVAWITGRHIKRVRLAPTTVAEFPRLDDERFIERDESNYEVRVKWERYIAELLLYYSQGFTARYVDEGVTELPFDSVTLARHIERLVMATEPWQSWFMEVRRLYRWENPRETAIWYGIFAVLWYTQHIVGFLHAYIIFIVTKNRYYPSSANSIRESLDRALDRGAQAYRWGELVDRHGREQWLEPLMDGIAPYMQLQLGDLAAFLEVLRNFYHWRKPSKTAATLFFFTACFILSLFADMNFCMKVFWFICINTFFLGWPVASRYPRYRFVVSPIRWVFWDIPSHPEWAIQFLQQHDVLRRSEMKAQETTHATTVSGSASGPQDKGDELGEQFQDSCETQEQVSQPRRKADVIKTGDDLNRGTPPSRGDQTNHDQNTISFQVSHRGRQGRLVLCSEGLRFVIRNHSITKLNPKKINHRSYGELWSYPFTNLVQMTKRHSPTSSKVAGMDPRLERLELELLIPSTTPEDYHDDDNVVSSSRVPEDQTTYAEKSGVTTRIETLDVHRAERDEIFNLIVGWSNARWQVLSTRGKPETTKNKKKLGKKR